MGRPREHDEATAAALLEAAERVVEAGGWRRCRSGGGERRRHDDARGLQPLRLQGRARRGARRPRLRPPGAAVAALPETDDPAADLVQAGLVFRRFAREHPALFMVGVQRALPSRELWERFRGAAARRSRRFTRDWSALPRATASAAARSPRRRGSSTRSARAWPRPSCATRASAGIPRTLARRARRARARLRGRAGDPDTGARPGGVTGRGETRPRGRCRGTVVDVVTARRCPRPWSCRGCRSSSGSPGLVNVTASSPGRPLGGTPGWSSSSGVHRKPLP